jgi:flagellar hook-length control protein FliK
MAINDILPQVDPVPGLGNDRRPEKPAFVTDVDTSDSSYQRALSRSLNDRDRKEPPSSDRTPKPENSSPHPADQRPSPQPAEKPRASRSTDETNESSRQEPTPRSTTASGNEREDVNQTEAETPATQDESNESAADVVNAAAVVISIQPPPAEISTGDYQEPKPPANLSSLFATTTTDEQNALEVTTLDVETSGDELLRPPDGLFEIPAANKGQQQSASEASQTENAQISPNAVVETETLNADLLPTDQTETDNSATPNDADTSNVSTDARVQDVDFNQPTDVQIAQPNAAAAAESAAATRSTNSEETPDGTASGNTSSNTPAPASLLTGESSQSGRLTQNDETGRHRKDQEQSHATAEGTSDPPDESTSTPQTTSARHTELVSDNGNRQRTDLENRSEPTSESDTSKSSVTAVRSDSGRTTIPVPNSPSTPSLTDTLPVDPEQLVERVAAGIRAASPNGQQLRVKLYPPHLGQLQIEVNSHGGTVSVRMEVQNVAAQNALHDNLPLLREALVHHGTSIDRIDVQLVETNAEDGRSDLTDEQQQQSRQESDDHQPNRDEQEPGTAEESETDRQPVAAAHNMDELDIQV